MFGFDNDINVGKEKQAQQLINDVNKKVYNWNERSQFTLKGVKNLSRSDMDTLEMYADAYIRQGNFDGFIKPIGEIAEVFQKYGIMK